MLGKLYPVLEAVLVLNGTLADLLRLRRPNSSSLHNSNRSLHLLAPAPRIETAITAVRSSLEISIRMRATAVTRHLNSHTMPLNRALSKTISPTRATAAGHSPRTTLDARLGSAITIKSATMSELVANLDTDPSLYRMCSRTIPAEERFSALLHHQTRTVRQWPTSTR